MKQIKCKKCLEEWYVSPERLYKQKVCPFCDSPIQGTEEITNIDSLDKAIYTAVIKYGADGFDNPKRLVGFISDVAPNLEKETRIFSRIIADYHIQDVKLIFEQNVEDAKAEIIKLRAILIEDEGLADSTADMLCNNLFKAFLYYKGFGWIQLINVEISDVQFESSKNNLTPPPMEEEPIYEAGRDIVFGKYKWTILSVNGIQNSILLISKNAVTRMPFNNEYKEITWENCTLRKWLNNEFYMSFTQEERRRIALVNLKNKDYKYSRTTSGADTKDHVFLLSRDDIKMLMPQENQRKLVNGTCWWVRSPGIVQSVAVLVNSDGAFHISAGAVDRKFGVRPAIMLKMYD